MDLSLYRVDSNLAIFTQFTKLLVKTPPHEQNLPAIHVLYTRLASYPGLPMILNIFTYTRLPIRYNSPQGC